MEFDVFISYASEDADVARPLAELLRKRGIKVWIDQTALTLGDSLSRSIDRGLVRSRFGVVVLSQNFFRKAWPQKELDGLTARETVGSKVILPIWHNVSEAEVLQFSPSLAGRLAISTAGGLNPVADAVAHAITAIVPETDSVPAAKIEVDQPFRLEATTFRVCALGIATSVTQLLGGLFGYTFLTVIAFAIAVLTFVRLRKRKHRELLLITFLPLALLNAIMIVVANVWLR